MKDYNSKYDVAKVYITKLDINNPHYYFGENHLLVFRYNIYFCQVIIFPCLIQNVLYPR